MTNAPAPSGLAEAMAIVEAEARLLADWPRLTASGGEPCGMCGQAAEPGATLYQVPRPRRASDHRLIACERCAPTLLMADEVQAARRVQ